MRHVELVDDIEAGMVLYLHGRSYLILDGFVYSVSFDYFMKDIVSGEYFYLDKVYRHRLPCGRLDREYFYYRICDRSGVFIMKLYKFQLNKKIR